MMVCFGGLITQLKFEVDGEALANARVDDVEGAEPSAIVQAIEARAE